MSPSRPAAELSSLTTGLAEIARRITALAERCAETEADDLSQGLFEVERTLGEAQRRLDRLNRMVQG